MRCPQPISIRQKDGSFEHVPCGKCMACLSNRRNSWSVRLQHELKHANFAHFITLTYDDYNIWQNENTVPSVNKSHVQKFFKRFRHAIKPHKFKYFLTAEYGSQTFRPHYHFIAFNLPYTSEDLYSIIESTWNYGSIHIGTVTPASINYTTKYCVTKNSTPDGATPTFSLMSQGLGSSYIEKSKKFHRSNQKFYVTMLGGTKVSMPRYYRDKIFTENEKKSNAIRSCKINDSLDKPRDFYERIDASFKRKQKKFDKHNIF